MNFFITAGSLRSGSLNKTLASLVAGKLRTIEGVNVDLADFNEFDMPLFNGDLEKESGLPEGAKNLLERMRNADGVILASPEYNFSLSGVVKNAFDWVSRDKSGYLKGKSTLLLAASTSVIGGIRGLWQLRIPLEGMSMFVYPDMFALASAQKAFDENGALLDEAVNTRLDGLLQRYVETTRRLVG